MSTHDVITVDCEYLRPGLAAAYLRVAGDEAAFVETNTAHAAPKLLGALERRGLRPEQVRWIIVTHAHLDHAGGAGALMRACPNATLLAHPRAARHLIDPSKLVASATKVYGEDRFRELYGILEPVPAERVRSLDDGAQVSLGDASLRFLHVRGHANHHFVVHDPAIDAVFTGDAFGLVYPSLQRPGPFAFPSTSPTDFDPIEARRAIDRIMGLGARVALLTHFGEVRALDAVAAQLRRWIDISEDALEDAVSADISGQSMERVISGTLWAAFERLADAAGLELTADDRALLELDVGLNAQGIAWVADKRRAAAPA
jgi:glyoxylase-like metal-dependent hydrolase (beta-lactamase superfamily II)